VTDPVATLTRQCWLFAVGSTLFAVGTAPGFSAVAGAGATNVACFVGSWFFTTAAALQLTLSGPRWRAEWLSAATQLVGTVLFNVSTGTAVWAHLVSTEQRLVWTPDAVGSLAFLVSGALGVAAVAPRSRDAIAAWVNMAGCVAFGVSAGAAFVRADGITEDALLANSCTFVGAACFLLAALMLLPARRDTAADQ
jgi:hypothetical protein